MWSCLILPSISNTILVRSRYVPSAERALDELHAVRRVRP
jgi:hypothetical protein